MYLWDVRGSSDDDGVDQIVSGITPGFVDWNLGDAESTFEVHAMKNTRQDKPRKTKCIVHT